MAFPTTTFTEAQAASALGNAAAKAGLDLTGLSTLGALQCTVANLLTGDPSTSLTSAADITAATFGATASETGAYTFPGALVITTQGTFGTKLVSSTALATPSALAATAFNAFASTVSGATLMGFGTTGDVTLKSRAGTDAFYVAANSINCVAAGTLTSTGNLIVGANALVVTAATGAVAFTGAVTGVTDLTLGAANSVTWNGVSAITGAGSGKLKLSNSAGTAFSTLYYGQLSGATTSIRFQKAIASIADNTDTAVFTVTVPNAAHSGVIRVTLCGSLGAGGAVGANEATHSIAYDIAITRTAGVATVATVSSAYGSANSAVAGAATITTAGSVGAMTGAVSATQTFPIYVKITKGGGSSDNHTCVAIAEVLNANASGLDIA